MIEILTRADEPRVPAWFDQMFRGRAKVFHERLRWRVVVRDGREMDRYDEHERTIYLMAIDTAGQVVGSLRLLRAVGETMLDNEFRDFFSPPIVIRSAEILECTRFCVHGDQTSSKPNAVSSELMIGLCEFALANGIREIIGLYTSGMTRIYRRVGWEPREIAVAKPEFGRLILGTWAVSTAALQTMTLRAGSSRERAPSAQ
ncbi:MAG: acyl-homoserine-lactone synthase [Bradyrhizobium sp.]|jgi:acyl homoserine lactone synthase|uniref:GNAT family N-acetyltransferase n=2 Tax=Bradyrhizobium TaxID=374 RepID=A0ABS5GDT6_9BRAD|nr:MULTISPECIES: acyl-homoserine-lactone synthase [Bradyrhizobium]MBR1139497.1 GNAT family N-acetyltransferase [Bradyrhizobium denitrificans]MDU0956575.1 acyl-homoserine-lactone synthase [Bradyrhizobium sp.]MDU1494694.1 acyl-homoserine-lactone synthase [Bradyrhizobium sp.]MDU1544816.1 acyl-homoserine-lactone synthase [Bradyrhizobium sp.]MDU1666346.1 acyl-homoserine-lactone synthase [Bradyrhizobium sp.]